MSKIPQSYLENPQSDPHEIFKPGFSFDSHGRLYMPLTPYHKLILHTKPGSQDIGTGSESPSSGPETDPGALKTGSFYASTVITVGGTIKLDASNSRISVGASPGSSGTSIILDDTHLAGFVGSNIRFGFFLTDSGTFGTGDFFAGNTSGHYIHWDDSAGTLNIKGNITVTGGNLGDLAFKDQAGASDLDTTVISGGYIITGLLTADNIQTGTLDADKVDVTGTITGPTIQTAASGSRVKITGSGDEISFLYDNTVYNKIDQYSWSQGYGLKVGDGGGAYLDLASGTSVVRALLVQDDTGWPTGSFGIYGDSSGISVISDFDIIPNSSGNDLGSPTYSWDNLYFDSWYLPNGDVGLDYDSGDQTKITIYKHLKPNSASAQLNLGDNTYYWNEIFYKYLNDVGCLGYFDKGVELQNGQKVSDMEAIMAISPHPTEKTRYGVPRIDYQTLPKTIYRPAPTAEKDIYEKVHKVKNGKVVKEEVLKYRKGEKMGLDGASFDGLFGVLMGAVKELNLKVQKLEENIKKL